MTRRAAKAAKAETPNRFVSCHGVLMRADLGRSGDPVLDLATCTGRAVTGMYLCSTLSREQARELAEKLLAWADRGELEP